MAKSLRSKVKRSFRSKKRESGIYAATEAARLHRLSSKVMSLASKDHEGVTMTQEQQEQIQDQYHEQLDSPGDDKANAVSGHTDNGEMDLDTKATVPSVLEGKRISTHGPRGSRREQWRISKGRDAKGRRKRTNRSATHNRKVGRSKTKR